MTAQHNEFPTPPSASSPHAIRRVAMMVGALLAVVVVALAVAINEGARINQVAEHALNFDLEVEDEGDDIRIAIFELRQVHRNIALGVAGTSPEAQFDAAYAALEEEMGELEALDLTQYDLTQPELIRRLAEEYRSNFRPAIPYARSDRARFATVSREGLRHLDQMDAAASELDEFGEQLADDALDRVNASMRTEQAILIGLMIGAVGIAVVLTLAAIRVLHQLQELYAREQQTQAALAAALRAKTDFVADASHELRTPLAIILGNAETALSSSAPPDQAAALVAISEEARSMSHLVDDLLFLARSDAGSPPLEFEVVPARWLATRISRSATRLVEQRGACIETSVIGEGFLQADPERVQQAAIILVDNAVRHSPPGLCVTLTAVIGPDDFVISVRDRGPGISPDELPRIFERFYQVKAGRTRSRSGSGLGLSIAQSLATAHGGQVTASSQPGAGTEMRLQLPLTHPADLPPGDELNTPRAELEAAAT